MFLPCPVRSLLPCPCTLPSAFTPRPRPCNVSLPLPLPLPLPLARQPGANINGVACYKPSQPPPDPRPPTPDHPLRSWNRVSDTRAFSSHPLAPSVSRASSRLPAPWPGHAPPIQREQEKKQKEKATLARHSPFCSPSPPPTISAAPLPGTTTWAAASRPANPLAFPAPPDRFSRRARARGTACVISVAGRLKKGGPEWPRHRCCLCCCNPARRARALDQRHLSPRSLPTDSQERNPTLTSQWTSNRFYTASSGSGSSCCPASPFSRRLALKSQASTIPCGSNPPPPPSLDILPPTAH